MKKVEIAKKLGMSRQRLDAIIKKQDVITKETYKKIHKYFPDLKFEKITVIKYRIIRGDSNDNSNDNN